MAIGFAPTFLACGGIFLLSFFDLGILVCRAVARSERPPVGKVRPSYTTSRLRNRPALFEIAPGVLLRTSTERTANLKVKSPNLNWLGA